MTTIGLQASPSRLRSALRGKHAGVRGKSVGNYNLMYYHRSDSFGLRQKGGKQIVSVASRQLSTK
eukprot:1978530-Amphidinium_carterae.1